MKQQLRSAVDDGERLRMRQRPRGPAVLRQRWLDLGFLHWSVDPIELAGLLPPGLELDTWEGRAYVGIVPFEVRSSRPAFVPAVPFANFCEVNLRTYVHRRGRNPGVFFFSLDASSRLAVWGARATYRLPYFHAAMALGRSARGVVSFSSRRTGAPDVATFACTYRPTSSPEPATPGTLAFFLIERYLLYSWDGRLLRKARVWHTPYPVTSAETGDLSEGLTNAAGISVVDDAPPISHYAEGVDVRIYAPSLVRERSSEKQLWLAGLARRQRLPGPQGAS